MPAPPISCRCWHRNEQGPGLTRLGSFSDHEGYDGVMPGYPEHPWNLEFTRHRNMPAGRAPTEDNLLVLYIEDAVVWYAQCLQMHAAGFMEVQSCNPCRDHKGITFEDADGYRVVLQQDKWQV